MIYIFIESKSESLFINVFMSWLFMFVDNLLRNQTVTGVYTSIRTKSILSQKTLV